MIDTENRITNRAALDLISDQKDTSFAFLSDVAAVFLVSAIIVRMLFQEERRSV